MKTIIKPIVFFVIIFLFYFYSLLGSSLFQIEEYKIPPIETDTVYIDDDFNPGTPGWGIYCFDTIQYGITTIDAGGVVYVYSGIYYENIVIDKQIEFVGEDNNITVINGQYITDVITVLVDSVLISGFRIMNGSNFGIKLNSNYNSVIGNKFSNHYERAIDAYQVGNQIISNNFFYLNSKGIKLYESNFNLISNNFIEHGKIWLYGNYNEITNNYITYNSGIRISASIYNSIIDNTIKDIIYSGPGISLDHTFFSDISGNLISNCGKGIEFHACDSNKISMNTIAGNSEAGIILPDCMCGGCNHNSIYHNNFINNGYHAVDNCNNNWDAGYPSGGNFWDNYNGVDNFSGPNQNIPGSDSIGDTPYYILGGNEEDLYPLMYPVGMPPFADEVYVDDDFDENTPGWGYDHFNCIMDGINLTENNGSVHVANGVYYETISINKQLSLFGANMDSTIIDGNESGTVIYVSSESIIISGFTIQNSGESFYGVRMEYADDCQFYGNKVIDCYNGVYLKNSIKSSIVNNIINNCNSLGLFLAYDDSCIVKQNTITANRLGFGMSYTNSMIFSENTITDNGIDGGMLIQYSEYNRFFSNTISENNDYGILIKHHCNNNTFLQNRIIGNLFNGIRITEYSVNNNFIINTISENEDDGIFIEYFCNNNTFKGNKIVGNSTYGIWISESSNDNLIYHNVFNDNITANAYDECSNTWHNGYELPFNPWFGGGNYYGDYSDVDEFSGPWQNLPGSDGIGDDAYTILGNNGNYDAYPFMNEYGWHIRLREEGGLVEGSNNPGYLDTLSDSKNAQNINSNYITEDKLSFTISPNPGKNLVVVQTSTPVNMFDFKLYDPRGNEILYSTNNTLNIELNSSLLPAGLYFYIITCENGYRQTGKWIKE